MWFTETATDTVGIMTPTGSVSEVSGLHGPADGIAVGSDGNLWLTEGHAGYIARLTPSKVLTEFQVTGGSDPTAIAAGPDGNLWSRLRRERCHRADQHHDRSGSPSSAG